jgi:hypothetical protein
LIYLYKKLVSSCFHYSCVFQSSFGTTKFKCSIRQNNLVVPHNGLHQVLGLLVQSRYRDKIPTISVKVKPNSTYVILT